MKKNILFVNSSLSSGGSEKVMTILANEFVRNGYDVSMILLYPQSKENYKIDNDIKLYRFSYNKKNRILRIFEKLLKIRKIVKENNFDYIISFMHSINTNVLIATLGINVPVIVSERCDPSSRKISNVHRLIEDISYKKAKYVVLQTEQVRCQYPKFLQKKLVVIPNPVSADILAPYNKTRKKDIIAIGRLTEQKNFKLLIDAFQQISNKYPKYNLYIYGEGPLEFEIKKQINDLGLSNRVFLPGYVDNVDEILNSSSLYISTSNYEGISNSMLEALAMGVPTICTDCPVGGAAMMIKSNINGILIPVGNMQELIKSISKILDDESFSKKLSINGTKIKNDYSSSNIFKKWEKLIILKEGRK